MRNFEKKSTKIISALTALGLVISQLGTAYAFLYDEARENTADILAISDTSEETDDSIVTPDETDEEVTTPEETPPAPDETEEETTVASDEDDETEEETTSTYDDYYDDDYYDEDSETEEETTTPEETTATPEETEEETTADETLPTDENGELPPPIIIILPEDSGENTVDPFNPQNTSTSSSEETSESTPYTSETVPTSSETSETEASDSSVSSDTSVSDAEAPTLVLTYYTFNLQIGQEAQIDWNIENGTSDGNTAQYYSTNTAVATVSATGNVTAVGVGSADIIVTVDGLTASVRVNASAFSAAAEDIYIPETSYNLKLGESAYIQASVLPAEAAGNYGLTFSSSNPETAEVDANGIITARSAGEAYVTVSCIGADISKTVFVSVTNEEMVYEKAKLSGFLYGTDGEPIAGKELTASGLSAVTDQTGYFEFKSLDKKDIVMTLADSEKSCIYSLSGDSCIWLLYGGSSLECFYGYDEMMTKVTVSRVSFESEAKRVSVGEIYIPYYQYEPSNASITQLQYISSDENVALVDQNGVITAKSIGEAIITLIVNGGQARAFFTLTVSDDSGKYSAVIAAAEISVLLAAAAIVAIIYKKYKIKAEAQAEDGDFEDYGEEDSYIDYEDDEEDDE